MSRREPMTARTVTIEGVTFNIAKMPAMLAKDLFETLRVGIADAVNNVAGDGSDIAMGVSLALGMPRDIFEEARQQVFRDISYSRAEAGGGVLLGDEDTAFEGLEVVHIYEVFARGLAVNFHGSWVALRSQLPQRARTALEAVAAEFLPST